MLGSIEMLFAMFLLLIQISTKIASMDLAQTFQTDLGDFHQAALAYFFGWQGPF